jgi:hypothetical protein
MRKLIFFTLICMSNFASAYTVKPAHLKCKKTEDCVVTNGSCMSYVGFAVARKYEKYYEGILAKECESHKGSAVSMSDGPHEISCMKNHCKLRDRFNQ